MNKIFKTIWNEALCAWIPVAEITKAFRTGREKTRIAITAALLGIAMGLTTSAYATPVPVSVTDGVTTLNITDAVTGTTTTANGYAINADGTGSIINLNAPGNNVTTTYSASSATTAAHAVFANNGGVININGDSTVTTTGASAYGLYADLGGLITSGSGINLQINTQGQGANGIQSEGAGSLVDLVGTTTITTTGIIGEGIYAANGGAVTAESGSTLSVTTTGASASGIYSSGTDTVSGAASLVTLNGAATVTASGSNGIGLYAINGGQIVTGAASDIQIAAASNGIFSSGAGALIDLGGKTEITGSPSKSVIAQGGSIITEEGSELNIENSVTSGTGIYAGGDVTGAGSVTLNGTTTIDLTQAASTGSAGIMVDSNGTVTTGQNSNLQINTYQSNAYGMEVMNGTIDLGGTTSIATGLAAGASSTTGIYVRTGGNLITEEGASLSVSTQGAGSYGIFGDTNSTTTLDGTTTVTTTGDSADGVVANGGGSITTGSGSDLNVTTQGASAYGIFSVGSVAISGNAEVQTAGSGADGILAYSGGQLTTASASTVTVNTSGDSTYGIWSYGTGSLVDLSGPTSVTTTGSNSHGVFAYSGGTVTTESGSDLTVNTSTDDSYGIWASASTVTLGGTAEVTTAGNGAYGVVASSGGVITSNDDLTVSTTGATDASGSGSYGIFATGTSSQIILNGSANQITTTGSTSYGVYAYNGGQVTTGTASNATINTSGDYADGINSFGTDSQVILNGATTVTTQGLGAAGVIASTGGGSGTTSVTANGTIQITTTGDYSDGIDSEWSGSQVTLNGAATVATQGYEAVGVSADEGIITANNNLQVSTTGDNAYGLYAADGGTLDVATSGLTVSTTGASAVGALLYGIGSVMDLNGGTITTTGTEASGFMTFAGAAKTFDGTTNNILPTITVYGNDSAVLEASGTDSVTGDPSSITVAGSTALNMAETAGANTWGARAVNGGIITFADTSSTGGTALWANGGTIALAESGDASGSNVQIDTNGILDVIQASGNANIGSLSSPVADTTTGALDTTGVVNLGTNTLTIGNNNSTSNGSLIDDANFAGTINGTGNLVKTGTLTQILSGNNTYTGTTTVSGGALYIDGDQTAATGATTVASGATLGGTGTVGGNVTIANGGTLDPGGADGSIGTLTINGNLALNSTSNLNYNFGAAGTPGGTLNDLTVVNGDLTLGGTLNVTQAPDGSFDPGVYRVISYTGALTDNGLVLGTMPAGSTEVVQTSVPGQVNLVNITGTTLNFWDGDAGPKGDGVVNGGNGTWNVSNNNWTTSDGTLNAPYTNGSFAIFEGTPGTVTVDNTNGQVISGGMQFVTSGYTITGGSVELADGANIIRVGDGTTAGAGYTATIVSDLTGSGGINKTDAGTLILTGANSYTGGTTISGGTIQISADNDLGDLSGTLSFNGGTLNTTGTFSSERTTTINANGGTFNVNDATTFTMDGNVAGQGSLTKTGTGELLLSGQTLWTGGTTINAGTLTLNGNHGGAQLTGVITGQAGTTLNIDNGATWNLTGNSTLGNLNGNNGNLGINTNIAAGTNNHITADTANGNIAITVANTGGTITGKAPTLELIQVNNPNASNGNYTLSNGPIPVGLYNYNLLSGQQLNMGASNSANWYLSPSYGKELTTLLGASDQTGTWLMTNDSLLQRMGELRTSSTDEQKHSYQTWVRGYGWQANVNTTNSQVGYKENTYGVDLGADRVWQTPGWKIYTGIMLGYTNSQRTMTGGAGKSTADTVYGGIYGTWINDKGYYIDALAKIGSIHNSIKAYDTENSSASYSNLGLTASLEVGKQFKTETGWYVEPQVQGTVLNFTGAGFTTSGNAASILQKGNISYDLRAGAVAGKNIKTERGSIQPYVKAMYGQSWTNRGGISYNGDTMAANTGGNRYQVGGGVAWQIAQSTELHVDYEYIKGSRIEVPWKFNAGVRYNW